MASTERRDYGRDGYPPRALTVAVLALVAIVLGLVAVAAISETTARAVASYAPVEATVVDERIEMRLVADRRGSRPKPYRMVTVELSDGTSADVRSDDLAVGATATVYRSDAGAIYETPPAPPGFLEWTLCAAAFAATVVLGVVTVRAARRLRVDASGYV